MEAAIKEIRGLMIEQHKHILRFYEAFDDDTYSDLLYEKKIAYHASMSSLNYLSNVNEVIDAYLVRLADSVEPFKADIMLSIFGLLQSLFVGIDSLYELSKGITRRKWSVNINQNKYLHQIKYIRNDIVGHPAYRVYSKEDIGFCRLNLDEMSLKRLTYTSFSIMNNSEVESEREVDIVKLLENYYEESNDVLDAIYNRLVFEQDAVSDDLSISLADDVFYLFEDYKKGFKNTELLEKIKESYERINGNVKTSDRFLWRIKLIDILFKWEEDNEKRREMVRYMCLGQISKLHSMGLQVDKDNNVKFSKSCVPTIKYPTLLKYFYKYCEKKYDKIKHYLEVIHDSQHPLFTGAVTHLNNTSNENESVEDLCDWLFEVRKIDSEMVFLIGSEMKRAEKYLKENSK